MSGVNPASFTSAGQTSQHWIPGAYSRNNFISNEGGGVSSGNICILGYASLGEPQKLLIFDSYNDALTELESGELLDGIKSAFNPGNDLKPQQVGCMRVNPGTQAERILQASAVDLFGLKSSSYGVPMNQLRLRFSAGTLAGTYRIRTDYKGTTNDTDNITRESLQIQYTGAGTDCLMSITETKLTTVVTGGPGEEALDITLEDLATIGDLVDFINNQTAYTASLQTTNENELSSVLDMVSSIDIFTGPYTANSNYQAVYEAFLDESFIGGITKEGVNRVVPDVDADYVYFTGATSGTYTTSDFSESLEVLEEEDLQLLSTTSTEESVHLLIKNHCVDMNSVEGRKERQFYVGGALSEDVSAVTTRALNINSAYGSICSPGFYSYNDAGVKTLYSPAMFACQQVGMVSALALNTPTTFKKMNNLGWEKDYKRSEKNELIQNGVLCGAKDTDGLYITVRSVTTYQSPLLQKNEASIMRESLYQASDLRNRMEKAVIGTPNLGNIQLGTVDAVFERAIRDWSGQGIIVSNDGKLYDNYVRQIVGDQIVIEYDTWNTAPTNFVFITHNISVLTQEV